MDNETKSRKIGVTAYKDNPFWSQLSAKIKQKRISIDSGYHVSSDGEHVGHSGVHAIVNSDADKFVKFYAGAIPIVLSLRPATIRVFFYLMSMIQQEIRRDSVYMNYSGACEFFEPMKMMLSKRTFHRALKELIEREIIAESTIQNFYWINPRYCFNGDRMSYIKEDNKQKNKNIGVNNSWSRAIVR